MLPRLPYRIKIPLGLALAVMLSALLVIVVAAQISARTARQEIVSTVKRVMQLQAAQGRPLLMADDTWGAFALLRDTVALMPDANKGFARAAILDGEGRILAGSDPRRLAIGWKPLGGSITAGNSPFVQAVTLARPAGVAANDLTLVQPIRSDDDKVVGFILAEVDGAAFAPDWAALSTPALIGAALAVIVLVPLGWLVGRQMAKPVAQIARSITLIGRVDLKTVEKAVPAVADPELGRIAGAVQRLVWEMSIRQENEQRALSAERLAAVGRITAAVAHEINNPLAGLLTATNTLRLHGEASDTRLRSVNLIERGLHQIRTMTTALLPQARVEDRCMSPSDLDDVLTLAQTTAALHFVSVTSDIEQRSELFVPSSIFRQAMLNMLLNAIKAAGNCGSVHASCYADADVVRFTVTNTGQALSPQALQELLLRGGGNDPHGFGLWICREFAVRYCGGFAASEAELVAPPYCTSLTFWIPNRERDEIAAIA